MIRNLLIVGSSTGGCRVVHDIFARTPFLDAATIIVQHMPKFINFQFARTLSQQTKMKVKLAETGDTLRHGEILIAPSDLHLAIIDNDTVKLFDGPKVNYVKPAIDVTMASLKSNPGMMVGVILTGMGEDGAAGLMHMKQLGAVTFAQSQSSSAVFGMPGKAIETGCVDYILDPQDIAEGLALHLGLPKKK